MVPNVAAINSAAIRTLKRIRQHAPDQFGMALRQEAEIEATECKRACPVEFGALRASIHAEGPTRDGRDMRASIVAGGPAAPYALIVHEDLEALHTNGEAKYIERPLRASAPSMAARIIKRIDLNKAAK